MQIKIIISIAVFIVGYFVLKKKDPPTDEGVADYTPNQSKARKVAIMIQSALGVKSSSWSWTEDEEAVIKALNENFEIQNLIAIEYKKLTQNVLMEDISKYLTIEEIEQININKI
jgi:hypothetical protein